MKVIVDFFNPVYMIFYYQRDPGLSWEIQRQQYHLLSMLYQAYWFGNSSWSWYSIIASTYAYFVYVFVSELTVSRYFVPSHCKLQSKAVLLCKPSRHLCQVHICYQCYCLQDRQHQASTFWNCSYYLKTTKYPQKKSHFSLLLIYHYLLSEWWTPSLSIFCLNEHHRFDVRLLLPGYICPAKIKLL